MKARAQAAPEKDQQTPSSMTLEAYFDFEYRSTTKHEFWNGQVRAMSYTSPNHGRIQTNIMDELAACMKANGCTRYTSDRMVFIPECNKVFYPDVMIICGAEQFEQYKKNMKATLNPSVIIEILSDTTEQEDKIDKWMCYRTIPHLQQYLMVHQNTISIHSYRRKGDREWDYSYAEHPEEHIMVQDCVLRLNEVYRGVELPSL